MRDASEEQGRRRRTPGRGAPCRRTSSRARRTQAQTEAGRGRNTCTLRWKWMGERTAAPRRSWTRTRGS
eukprot:6311924-Prymnesium_polylepis.3